MREGINSFIGQVDQSGTWTDGKVVGSPEWAEAMLDMDMVSALMNRGIPPEKLMGIFDKPVEARRPRPINGPEVPPVEGDK